MVSVSTSTARVRKQEQNFCLSPSSNTLGQGDRRQGRRWRNISKEDGGIRKEMEASGRRWRSVSQEDGGIRKEMEASGRRWRSVSKEDGGIRKEMEERQQTRSGSSGHLTDDRQLLLDHIVNRLGGNVLPSCGDIVANGSSDTDDTGDDEVVRDCGNGTVINDCSDAMLVSDCSDSMVVNDCNSMVENDRGDGTVIMIAVTEWLVMIAVMA